MRKDIQVEFIGNGQYIKDIIKMIKQLFRDNELFKPYYSFLREKWIKYSIKKYGIKKLEEVTESFNDRGIVSFADFGTLLGIVRDNKLLKHDDDIDVGVLVESSDTFGVVRDTLYSLGYKMTREFTVSGNIKEQSYRRNGVNIDIQFYFFNNNENLMYCYLFYNPSDDKFASEWKSVIKKCPIVEDIKKVNVNGKNVYIPSNAEIILNSKYGDNWRIPDKGWVYWEGPNTFSRDEIGLLERFNT